MEEYKTNYFKFFGYLLCWFLLLGLLLYVCGDVNNKYLNCLIVIIYSANIWFYDYLSVESFKSRNNLTGDYK